MPGYRCFFYGPDGHIAARDEYLADGDELAIIEGRARYAESEFRDGFEVWELGRLIHSEGRISHG